MTSCLRMTSIFCWNSGSFASRRRKYNMNAVRNRDWWSGASSAGAGMIGIDGNLAGLAATTQLAKAAEDEQKQEEKRTTAANVLEGVADGIDVIGLGVDGCKAVAKAMQPSHVTGGKDAVAGFTTGGGDGAGNAFQTVADCLPVAEATDAVAESAGFVADTAGVVGDVLSGTADVVGGIIGGIFDGL